ncbi:FxSxx-COOH system tetratricopeptide repeat protein [Streptomyces ossamyceticus]|uniref:FxSxx-COOH system tetratricopeptide repeat protein n=1 Tax=Streptomyces ossamyceticus TaxID=249581 RepID=A0ABV2USZ6_9ACTN
MTASGQGSVAAGGDVGQVVTGDGAVAVQYQIQHAAVLPAEAFVPVTEVMCPPNLTNLPKRLGMFVGRERELVLMDGALDGEGGAAQAVHGLGGVGKSTLAAHWAASRSGERNPVWWITADTPSALDAGLAALAMALQPALTGVLPFEALAERAVQWLATHQGWLLVLDNVTEPADIQPYLARAGTGAVMITSRRATGWHGIATPVQLDVLEQGEAIELFVRILTYGQPNASTDGAGLVCEELGLLPLAIEQAAAFCAETSITPRDYLGLLASYPAELYAASAEGGDAERTIARIWHLTLDRLADDPLTGQILRALAWYAPTHIPRTLLKSLAELPALLRALGRLSAHSMLTLDQDSIAVPRLVQAVTRTPDLCDPHRHPDAITESRAFATSALTAALPTDPASPSTWGIWRVLLPHTDALTSHVTPDTVETARILYETGRFLLEQGAVYRAMPRLQRALATYELNLGNDHPDTLASRSDLAGAYESAGDLQRAIPLFERTLSERRRLLGNDHPDTLASRSDLAGAYESTGDLQRAIPLYEETLSDSIEALGSNHRHTMSLRNNLAYAYQSAGHLQRAIQLYEQALSERVRILGNDHPDTLASRNHLANALQAAGNLERAVDLHEQTLAERVRILGNDHPHTLASRDNLAVTFARSGDLERAIRLHEQTLAERVRILGNDHPDTLASRNNLASACESAGAMERAIELYEEVVNACRRLLGEENPRTLISQNNLAYAYQTVGDRSHAVGLYESTLTGCRRTLGDRHPLTLTVFRNLAASRWGR